MARDVRQIRIESILGGISPTSHFAAADQFRVAIGIDPGLPVDDSISTLAPSGLLRPTPYSTISTLGSKAPMWMVSNPKDSNVYVFDARGSMWTQSSTTVTAFSDAGELSNGQGNGAEYYDNYIYVSKNTTVARYGPLNGTPTLNGDYWGTTLSKTALTDTTYPTHQNLVTGIPLPNHILKRHSDGKLYIADVVGNQGYLHYIATSKTTVEGDTDNGSTYSKLAFGYGLWPTAIESYGQYLAIALYEGPSSGNVSGKAKLAIWDTTSQNFNQILWTELPDTLITALKNENGVLYMTSCSLALGASQPFPGFRVSQYVGGYTIKELGYFVNGYAPYPGGIDGSADRLLFGSASAVPYSSGCVYSLGLQSSALGRGMFAIMQTKQGISMVTSLTIDTDASLNRHLPLVGYASLIGGVGIDRSPTGSYAYDNALNPQVFQSQAYRIGQPFKITKIRIPLAQSMAANMIVTPKVYTDDGAGTTYTLTTINNTNYPGKRNIVIRPKNLTGEHNFFLELKWTGSALCTVGLPITIEYELIDD